MTIREAIVQLDTLKHNTYSDSWKIRRLSNLDKRVFDVILSQHEGGPETFTGYDPEKNEDAVLLVAAPHDDIYLRYLEAMIDYHNGEIEKYNNSSELFEAAWLEFMRYYTRTHMPRTKAWKYR